MGKARSRTPLLGSYTGSQHMALYLKTNHTPNAAVQTAEPPAECVPLTPLCRMPTPTTYLCHLPAALPAPGYRSPRAVHCPSPRARQHGDSLGCCRCCCSLGSCTCCSGAPRASLAPYDARGIVLRGGGGAFRQGQRPPAAQHGHSSSLDVCSVLGLHLRVRGSVRDALCLPLGAMC